MMLLIFFLTCILGVLGLTILAAQSDLRTMTIDNIYSVAIATVFIICYGVLFASGKTDIVAPIWSHLITAIIMFIITIILFSLGLLGGADSKMISALSLWIGLKGLPIFLITMTIIGGVLGILALILNRRPIIKNPAEGSWIARAQAGEHKVPYGIAIAGGATVAFTHLGYLDFSRLIEFLI